MPDPAALTDEPSAGAPPRVLHMSPFAHWGGAITAMLTLVAEQAKRGPAMVFTLMDEYQADQIRRAGATAITAFAKGEYHQNRLWRVAQTMTSLSRAVRQNDIDLIHCHSAAGMKFCLPVARITGRPIVCHQRDNYRRDWFHAGLGGSAHVIAVSDWIKRGLPSRIRRKTTAIHDAVELPAVFPKPEGPILQVGMAGEGQPHKGHDILLEAALPLLEYLNFELHLWGLRDNEFAAALRRRLAKAPAMVQQRVHLEQFRPDIDAFFDRIDVAVIPSRFPDPFPRAATEAMARYKPVIAAGHGGMVEIVEHEKTGLIFKPLDANDLGVQLERMLGDAPLRRRLAQAGRLTVERQLAPGPYADACQAIYEEVVRLKPRRSTR